MTPSEPIRLAGDTFVVPSDGGARVVGPRGAAELVGPSIHDWLQRLTPFLDGTATLAELTDGLPDDKRAMTEQVVAALAEAGVLRTGAAPDDPLTEHLDGRVSDAPAAAHRARTARVRVVGTGVLADEVRAALRRADIDLTAGEADLVVAMTGRAPGGEPGVRVHQTGGALWISEGEWAGRADRWPPPPPVPLDGTRTAVAACVVGAAVLRALTEPAEPATAVRLDLATLTGTTHVRPPDDFAPFAAAPFAAVPFDVAAARLVDRWCGVLGEVSERDYTQLPVNVACATVAGLAQPVIGAGHTPALARERAARAGLERYLGADCAAVGSGDTYADAVTVALSRLCAELTARAPSDPTRVAVADLGGDDEAAAYQAMLAITGTPVEVYDITGRLGLPTLAYCSDGRTLAYASAPTAAATLAPGLLAVLLHEQSRRAAQPDYAPAPVPQLTPTARTGPPPDPAPATRVLEALAARLVPLDRDREVTRALRFAVGVVLDG